MTQKSDNSTQKGFMHRYHAKIILRTDYLKSDNTCALAMKVTINGKIKVLPLGISIRPDQFDVTQRRVKIPGKEGADINFLCDACESRAHTIFIDHRISHVVLTMERFEHIYFQEDTHQRFIPYAIKFVNDRSHTISGSHYNHSMLVIKAIDTFRPELTFSQINSVFTNAFDLWLKKKRMAVNTIAKYHQTFRTIILSAARAGMPVSNPYKEFRIKKIPPSRIYLSEKELRLIINHYEQNHHDGPFSVTLEAYIFSATCGGFRLSDLKRLTTDNIIDNIIVFTPYKTRRYKTGQIRLQLPAIGRKIIEGKDGKLFNLVSDQVCNRHLKDLAFLVGIDKPISMHTARHTFATQYLEQGGKVEKLQRILGHSRINDTMLYVHLTDKSVQQSMNIMDTF